MQTPDKDRLDLWLDAALRQRGEVDAREGLESRVLASVNANRQHRAAIGRGWILGGAVAFVVLIFFASTLRSALDRPHGGGRMKLAPPLFSPHAPTAEVARTFTTSVPKQRATPLRAVSASPEGPRREHFPSVRPPAPQELTLARYVERYPAEAALIAVEQENFDLGVQKTQQEIESEAVTSNQ